MIHYRRLSLLYSWYLLAAMNTRTRQKKTPAVPPKDEIELYSDRQIVELLKADRLSRRERQTIERRWLGHSTRVPQ